MKHYIIVKYREPPENRAALEDGIHTLFAKALDIPGVHRVSLSPAVLRSENRYDLMILMEMEREALPAFDQSEIHRLWKERYSPLLAAKAIFDCD